MQGNGVVSLVSGVDRTVAEKALKAADNRVEIALIMLQTGLGRTAAVKRLKNVKGNVRKAIAGR